MGKLQYFTNLYWGHLGMISLTFTMIPGFGRGEVVMKFTLNFSLGSLRSSLTGQPQVEAFA